MQVKNSVEEYVMAPLSSLPEIVFVHQVENVALNEFKLENKLKIGRNKKRKYPILSIQTFHG